MKKDIEWLKTEINKMYQDVASGARGLNAEALLFKVYELAKELDEPETLNEEWINEHSKAYTMENSVEISDLKNLLLPQPKKPALPQFVAYWIDAHNLHGNNPLREYRDLETDFDEGWTDEEGAEVYHWINKNPYAFIDALRYGYEVEKEKKYYVAFEDINLLYVTSVEVYGENEKLNYSSESSTENAIKFIDKEKASSLAYFLGAIVVEATQ